MPWLPIKKPSVRDSRRGCRRHCAHAAPPPTSTPAFAKFWSTRDPIRCRPGLDRHRQEQVRRSTTCSAAPAGGAPTRRDVADRPGAGAACRAQRSSSATRSSSRRLDPARKYQVRIQLHGGVNRPADAARRPSGIGRLAGSEQIYVLPQAWDAAPWWSDAQSRIFESSSTPSNAATTSTRIASSCRGLRRRHRRV